MHGEYFAEGSQFNRIATRYVMFASYIIVKKAEKVNIGEEARCKASKSFAALQVSVDKVSRVW